MPIATNTSAKEQFYPDEKSCYILIYIYSLFALLQQFKV